MASDIVVDSMIVDSGSVASSITKIFADHGLKSKQVATSVSGHSVIVKKISMATMTEEEMEATIRTEAQQHIPFEIGDVNLDYQVLSGDLGEPQMDVLLVAVKKDKILNYTNALQLAGRQPVIVDIDAFALLNCYEFNYVPTSNSTVALLNLGASVMNINIVKGTTPLFTRDVSVGGNQYTDALQKELDLSFDDAESLKLGQQGRHGQRGRQDADPSAGDGIDRSRDSEDVRFLPRHGQRRAHRADLHGRRFFADSRTDSRRCAGSFPCRWRRSNPFMRIDPPANASADLLEQHAPQLSVAVGLALRSFEDKL